MKVPFFRIVKSATTGLEKEPVLRRCVAALRAGERDGLTYVVCPADFGEIAESPFAYWVPGSIRHTLASHPSFEPTVGEVRLGGHTANDARWLRLWFEVPPERVGVDAGHVGFAKGGEYAPFYADVPLVVRWDNVRRTYLGFYGRPGRWTSRPEALDYYFRPGLTYPRRADSLNVRVLPAGFAFGDKGPSIFAKDEDSLLCLLGILNSAMTRYCDTMRSPRADAWGGGMAKSHEVGALQILPVPERRDSRIGEIALALFGLHRDAARFDEVTHDFIAPLFAGAAERFAGAWDGRQGYLVSQHGTQVALLKKELDERVFELYGVAADDRATIRADLVEGGVASPVQCDEASDEDEEGEGEEDKTATRSSAETIAGAAQRLLSYTLGCAFGRWDVRVGRLPDRAPPLGDPFEPVPRCSPGMLVGNDGLPAMTSAPGYPIEVAWDGILVDEKGHPRDLVARVHDAFVALFGANADDRIAEMLSILGHPTDLRGFFRDRFFEDVHRPMYTMGGNPPRRAPIYWPLYPKVGRRPSTFGIWLYYHRLTPDSLFTVARLVRDRRIAEDNALLRLRADKGPSLKGAAARDVDDALESGETFAAALKDFERDITHVANLRCLPDFDDGVILNCAVLHKVMPWKDAATAWGAFERGKYDWSNIAARLRPDESRAFRERERRLAEAAETKSAKGGRRKRKGG